LIEKYKLEILVYLLVGVIAPFAYAFTDPTGLLTAVFVSVGGGYILFQYIWHNEHATEETSSNPDDIMASLQMGIRAIRQRGRSIPERSELEIVLGKVKKAPPEGSPYIRSGYAVLDLHTTPHITLSGMPGTGKTTLARYITAQLYAIGAHIILVPGRHTGGYKPFLGFVDVIPIKGGEEYMLHNIAMSLNEQMGQRADILEMHGVGSYYEGDTGIKPIVVIADEYENIMEALRETDERMWEETARIFDAVRREGRQYGIHLITITQTPYSGPPFHASKSGARMSLLITGRQQDAVSATRSGCSWAHTLAPMEFVIGDVVFTVERRSNEEIEDFLVEHQHEMGWVVPRTGSGTETGPDIYDNKPAPVSIFQEYGVTGRNVTDIADKLPLGRVDDSPEVLAYIMALLLNGESMNAICRKVFGFKNKATMDIVRQVKEKMNGWLVK